MTRHVRGPVLALALAAAVAAVTAAAPAIGGEAGGSAAARQPDSPGATRGEARRILAEDRFRERSFPRPLRGALSALGKAIRPVTDFVGRAIGSLAGLFPGGRPVGFILLAAGLLAGFAALTASQLRTRISRRAAAAATLAPPGAGPSPRELERAATEAERAGELDLAVRLRFRAGLLRLGERGAIDARPSLTTAAIVRRIGSAELTRLARDFEQIAYGGRRAQSDDVEAQRSGWSRVLEEMRS